MLPTEPISYRTHCPAPASISNGYYVTDRQSETPLALPVLEHGEQYETGTIARYLISTIVVKQLPSPKTKMS